MLLRRALLASLLLLLACGDSKAPSDEAEPVHVTARAQGLGSLRVHVGPVVEEEPGAGRAWVSHELRLVNRSPRTVYLDDHRGGELVGDRRLLVADGCGYGSAGPDEPVSVVCTSDYRTTALEPGKEERFTLTLWRDLPGMNDLRPGRYDYRLAIRYRFDQSFLRPDLDDDPEAHVQRGTVVLTYSVPDGS